VVHVKGPEFQRLVDQAYANPKWTPATSRILAWTNERVQEYNLYVRKLLKLPERFQVGEIVVTNEFIKSPTSFTRSVDSEVEITSIHPEKTDMYGVPGYLIEIDNAYVSFMPENFKEAKQLMKELAAKKEWKRYFEIKETWFDLRAIYASSIHKAQGSTYDTVFLDLTDIGKNWQANDVARLMYVGITRAAKKVVCYGFLPDRYC
jgi:superfamily I DNA/RNA helicase